MAKLKEKIKQIKTSFAEGNERGARQAVIEDLFYDFNRSRVTIYKMNFIRGIFLGAGTVIGGTLIIALIAWILSLLGHIIPPLGDFFDGISHTIETPKR
jgi:hypothetical protein